MYPTHKEVHEKCEVANSLVVENESRYNVHNMAREVSKLDVTGTYTVLKGKFGSIIVLWTADDCCRFAMSVMDGRIIRFRSYQFRTMYTALIRSYNVMDTPFRRRFA